MFEINYDLDNIKIKSWHNWFHFFASILVGLIAHFYGSDYNQTFYISYGIGLIWEIGDGFKPWYYKFRPSGNKFKDWFVSNLLYSDKFSLQDVFIWDLGGALLISFIIERQII